MYYVKLGDLFCLIWVLKNFVVCCALLFTLVELSCCDLFYCDLICSNFGMNMFNEAAALVLLKHRCIFDVIFAFTFNST